MADKVVIPPALMTKITKILSQLLEKTQACCVLLADISGQLICQQGFTKTFDPVILSALTASNMAATAEIARQIGEETPFKLMFHEGDDQNIYLSNVAGSFLLVVLFSTKVQIGLVRLFTGQAVKNLLPLAAEFEKVQKTQGRIVDDEFGQALSTEIESLFGEN
jgi:predicted regulator of Ras-like GTPase activity (Roadblock/LC7/MglB family)